MKKIILICLIFFATSLPAFAQTTEKAELYFFGNPTCPHCAAERSFLDDLQGRCSQIQITEYVFSENIDLVKDFYQSYNVPDKEQGFVPVTFIGNKYFTGFNEEIGKSIETQILEMTGQSSSKEECSIEQEKQTVQIPFLGKTDIGNFSLPVLAIILGILDGFNVCSLGALILILGMTLTLGSKKKILIFGGVYIVTAAAIYGLLMFIWHQLFVFIAPYVQKMEILIGILALAGAIYLFREFIKGRKKGAVCRFGGISEKFSRKIQDIFEKRTSILLLGGAVLLFAAIITLVEFPCSAVFPALFTSILAEAGTPLYLSLLYIAIFLFFYMLDEIVIFLIAAFTMKISIISPKSTVFLNLLASILLFFLAFYYFYSIF